MEYALIKNFVTVAQTGSITRAAEVLYVAQSTVSHRLNTLEEQLGAELILRGKGKRLAELTASGRAFLPLAERWLSLWQEMERFRGEQVGIRLSVGYVNSIGTCLLQDFVEQFQHVHPNIQLKVQILDSATAYQKLRAGELDLAIVLTRLPYPTIKLRPLLSEPMYCICNREMFPGVSRISPRDLKVEEELLLNWGVEFSLWHDFRFGAGAVPKMEINDIHLMSASLQRGRAWSVVPRSVAEYFSREGIGKVLELTSPPPQRVSYVITSTGCDAKTQQSVDLFQDALDHFLGEWEK